MKLGMTVCCSVLVTSASIASAQIATQCASDELSASQGQGRNAWAVSCGYISAAARDFYNGDGDHIVFTSGCGRFGCSPFIPVFATDPCITGLAVLGSCKNGFGLTVDTLEGEVSITSSRGVDTCDGCDLAYPGGTSLTLSLSQTRNTIDCVQFTGWRGACAGQGPTCTLTINSDLSTSAIWSRIGGCVPK